MEPVVPAKFCASLSVDQLARFARCPLQFWLLDLLGKRGQPRSPERTARVIAHAAALQVLKEQQQTQSALQAADVEAVGREVATEQSVVSEDVIGAALRLLDTWHTRYGALARPVEVSARWRVEFDERPAWALTGDADCVVEARSYRELVCVQFVDALETEAALRASLPLAALAAGARHGLDLHQMVTVTVQQVTHAGEHQSVEVPIDDRRAGEALLWAQSARAALLAQLSLVTGSQPWLPIRSTECSGCRVRKVCSERFGEP